MAWFRTSGNNGGSLKVLTASGDIASFETNLPEPLQSVIVDIEATGGNGTPDNPNPINGYTEANITRCGVNLFSDKFSDYTKPVNYYIKKVPLKQGATYTLKATLKGTVITGCVVGIVQDNDSYPFVGQYTLIKTDGTILTFAPITIDNKWVNPKLVIYCSGETQFNSIFENYEISLVEDTDITYNHYNGQTYTIAFGQTVYGGVLDVTRGKLTVTHVRVTFDGTEVYQLYGATVVCNKYFTAGLGSHLDMKCSHQVNSQIGYANTDKTRFEFRNIVTSWGCADIDAFKTFIATQYANGTPIQILYPLATPFDIDLTPEVISAVVGENNVFAGCGQTTVKYLKRE